jgi:TetR/AcrR family transcriptional regulator, cholesterol catabolism regulator
VGKRNVKAAGEMREVLLQLAARSFAAKGYAATTMRSIADQAGIEPASIYYYFSSKEALVEGVVVEGAARIVQHIQDHLDTLPTEAGAEARFRMAIRGQMSALVHYGDYALAHGRLLAQLPDRTREGQVSRREDNQRLWNGLLEGLRAEGRLRDDVDISLCRVFLLGCINGVQGWFDPRKGSLEQVAEQVGDLFFQGVRPFARVGDAADVLT